VLRIVLDAVERHRRARFPVSGPKARIRVVACIHRFGSSLNEYAHFHVCVIDGVFELDSELAVRFIEVEGLDADDAEVVQAQVRRRILRAFRRRGLLEKDDRKAMEAWSHGGGFSLDASVRIEAHDQQGLERLLRYAVRPPFAADRRGVIDAQAGSTTGPSHAGMGKPDHPLAAGADRAYRGSGSAAQTTSIS